MRDIAGPQADDEITAGGDAVDDLGEFRRTPQRNHLAVAMRAQAENEMIAIDARDRRLAGRIDFGDNDRIGVIEAGAKFLEQRLQAGEAMRLHHGNDLAAGGLPRRLQHGCDLDRVMAVIVDR